MFEGARRQAAETMDRVFSDLEIGRQMVVKKPALLPDAQTPIPKKLMKAARFRWWRWGDSNPRPLTCEATNPVPQKLATSGFSACYVAFSPFCSPRTTTSRIISKRVFRSLVNLLVDLAKGQQLSYELRGASEESGGNRTGNRSADQCKLYRISGDLANSPFWGRNGMQVFSRHFSGHRPPRSGGTEVDFPPTAPA